MLAYMFRLDFGYARVSLRFFIGSAIFLQYKHRQIKNNRSIVNRLQARLLVKRLSKSRTFHCNKL